MKEELIRKIVSCKLCSCLSCKPFMPPGFRIMYTKCTKHDSTKSASIFSTYPASHYETPLVRLEAETHSVHSSHSVSFTAAFIMDEIRKDTRQKGALWEFLLASRKTLFKEKNSKNK